MAIVWDNRRYEKYRAPLLAGVIAVSLALAVFHDSLGFSFINFPHALYFAAVLAGILYGRRSVPLIGALGLVQALLIYMNTDGMVLAAAIDGAFLIVLACIMGRLSDIQGQLNARLRDSDRLLQSSEASYRTIFNAASDGIALYDPATGRMIDVNEAWVQLTGYGSEESVTLTVARLSAYEKGYDDREPQRYVAKALEGKAQLFPWKIRRKDGRDIWVEVNLKRITLMGRDLLIAIVRDITERKQAEEKLRESEGRYRDIVEQVNDWVWEVDAQCRYTYASPRVRGLLGYEPEEVIGKTPFDLMQAGEAERVRTLFGPIIGARQEFALLQNALVKKDGGPVVVETSGTPMFDGKGAFIGYRGTDRDITERKQAEDARREIDARFRVLTEMTASAILILQDGRIKYANPAVEKISGYSLAEMLAMSRMEATSVIDPASILKLNLVQFLRKKSDGYHRYEIRLRAKDGQKKWVDVTTGMIDYNGRPAYLATGFDITERKLAEQNLKASLHEKEVLLKEVHHRVKNNLQVVSSMLSLQSATIHDPAVAGIFKESQDRVRSMALIHEKLYKSGDLSRINFEEYVRNLTRYLMRSYNVHGSLIRLNIDAADVLLSIDLAIPCGLIINELVSNSLKYAFPDGREGTITVSIRREGKKFTLVVGDDGVGMPAHVDYRNTTSLGLQLVSLLVTQLEGDLRLSTEKGVVFTITFTADG